MKFDLKPDSILIDELKSLVSKERELTLNVLHYLREIESRKIHLLAGYSSLFEYCVKELGYSEGSAHRRLSAMRLIGDLPQVEEKIRTGKISLTVAAQAQNFFRERKKAQDPVDRDTKVAVLSDLEHSTARECERKLLALSPDVALPKTRVRALTPEYTLIQFVADRDAFKKFERLRNLLAHRNFDGDYANLFLQLADIALRKLDPSVSRSRSEKSSRGDSAENGSSPQDDSLTTRATTTAQTHFAQIPPEETVTQPPAVPGHGSHVPVTEKAVRSRYIPNSVRREVWRRNGARCAFVDSTTKRRCESRHGLQFDHRIPWSRGGVSSAQNLQLLCGPHNRLRAEQMGLSRKSQDGSRPGAQQGREAQGTHISLGTHISDSGGKLCTDFAGGHP
jgi:hypothetical protein